MQDTQDAIQTARKLEEKIPNRLSHFDDGNYQKKKKKGALILPVFPLVLLFL
jgi:hypothetical protein